MKTFGAWPVQTFALVLLCAVLVESFHVPRRRVSLTLCTQLSMRLAPISKAQMLAVVPRKITRPQLLSYWGMNSKERLQRILESLLVSYGGVWMAWFVSFMAGSLVSAVLGTALIFNWMYTPWLNARRRNARVYPSSGELETVYYAVFLGRIASLKKVRRRAGKSIGAVSQEFLVMQIKDERQRQLEVITQWQDCYSSLRVNMKGHAAIASADPDFSDLIVVSDVFIPAEGFTVGDYPYLQKEEFERLVGSLPLKGDDAGFYEDGTASYSEGGEEEEEEEEAEEWLKRQRRPRPSAGDVVFSWVLDEDEDEYPSSRAGQSPPSGGGGKARGRSRPRV